MESLHRPTLPLDPTHVRPSHHLQATSRRRQKMQQKRRYSPEPAHVDYGDRPACVLPQKTLQCSPSEMVSGLRVGRALLPPGTFGRLSHSSKASFAMCSPLPGLIKAELRCEAINSRNGTVVQSPCPRSNRGCARPRTPGFFQVQWMPSI